MNTPEEEAARAADDAALAAAEEFCKHWSSPPSPFTHHTLGVVEIARRLQAENRELRETLERVTRLALCALCGRVKDRHGIAEDNCDGYFEPPWIQAALRRPTRIAAIADAKPSRGKPPGFCILCGYDANEPIHKMTPTTLAGRNFVHDYTERI